MATLCSVWAVCSYGLCPRWHLGTSDEVCSIGPYCSIQVERRHLGLIRVGPQIVGFIVCCQFVQCFLYC